MITLAKAGIVMTIMMIGDHDEDDKDDDDDDKRE